MQGRCLVAGVLGVTVVAAAAREWPKDLERGFLERGKLVIEACTTAGRYGNTFFENEKRSYGRAMISILGGKREGAIDVWADGEPSPYNDLATAFVFRGDLLQQEWQGGTLQAPDRAFGLK